MIFSPLPGTPLISQGFGQNPDLYAPYGMAGHNGIDFSVPEGTTVYAPHDGVATVKDEGTSGYGLSVTIEDSKRKSVLAHLSAAGVATGQTVYQGDPIAKSGASGNATGPHLHWTYRIMSGGAVQNKDNGYDGAVDVTEFTRLWLDQDLHHDAEYTDDAKAYLAMTFASNQYLDNPNRTA
ncbi:MAG: peptidase M23 family protein [Candidatus Peregrinibacteria bacterium Greene0416_19]|nr:MAG: peptidase M23 family protein [Candidatus Peregrinibacteria bacterium Greene0416_19]